MKYSSLSLKDPDRKLRDLVTEYKWETFGCNATKKSDNKENDNFCEIIKHSNGNGGRLMTPSGGRGGPLLPLNTKIPSAEIESRYRQDPHVSFVVKAVSALTAAFRLVQLDNCAKDVMVDDHCLQEIHPGLHESIVGNMRKLSFSSVTQPGDLDIAAEIEGTRHHFTRSGKLVANKQLVYKITEDMGIASVRNSKGSIIISSSSSFGFFVFRLAGTQKMKVFI